MCACSASSGKYATATGLPLSGSTKPFPVSINASSRYSRPAACIMTSARNPACARRACKRRTRFGTNVAASAITSAVRTGRAASTTPVPIPPPKQSARQNAKPPVKKAAANTAATAHVYSRRRFAGKASANRSPHTIFPGRDNNGGKNNDAHAQQAPSADAMAMRRIGKRRAQSAAAMRSIRQSITKLSRRNSSIYICRPLPASTGTIPYAPCDMCRTNDAYIADNC